MIKTIFILSFLFPVVAFAKSFSKEEIAQILNAVDKQEKKSLKPLLEDRRLRKTPDMVNYNITEPIKLSLKKYKHFMEPYAIRLAKRFHKKWKPILKEAEQAYGVDQEAIVAILLVETSFGRFMGKYQPLSVFGSIYVDVEKIKGTRKYRNLPKKLKNRFIKKQKWALKELKAIANLTEKYPSLDQLKLKGSYAGAFGKCQFLPSSYLNFAVPYKKSKVPDLFDEKDAIVSVANYLSANGFKDGLDSKGTYESIYHYNNSDVYVKTVLGVARKLNVTP